MFSFLTDLPSWLFTLLTAHYQIVIGYIICVLFPIPWVNSFIIGIWADILTNKETATAATDVAAVVGAAESVVTPSVANVKVS